MLTFEQIRDCYQSFILGLVQSKPDKMYETSNYVIMQNPYHCLSFIKDIAIFFKCEPSEELYCQALKDAHVKFNMYVRESLLISEVLSGRGFPSSLCVEEMTTYQAMQRPIHAAEDLPIDDTDIQFSTINTALELESWARLHVNRLTDYAAFQRDIECIKLVWHGDDRFHFLGGFFGDQIVTASLLYISDGIVYCAAQATSPDFRRIGLASQGLYRRIVYAKSHGVTDFFMLNNKLSIGYAYKRGFSPVEGVALCVF